MEVQEIQQKPEIQIRTEPAVEATNIINKNKNLNKTTCAEILRANI